MPAEKDSTPPQPDSAPTSSPTPAAGTPVDVRALMAEIREKVKKSLAEGGRDRPQLRLHQADQNAQASRKAGELLHSEELRFLNTNYSFSAKLSFDSLASHRPGVVGRAIVAAKRKLIRIIFDSLLKDYFAAERDFNANVVRFLNDVSKYVDARDASNFWELIRKIDVDTTKAMERIERISDEHMASLRSSEKQLLEELYRSLGEVNTHLTKLQGSSEKHEVALQAVDSVARGIEGALARISKTSESTAGASAMQSSSAVVASGAVSLGTVPDPSYLMLENRFRGSEGEISKRMQVYPPLFMRAALPVLEIGPGRGELQLLFKELGVSSYGVDMDEAMVECAKERGVDARLGDGLKHLADIPDKSLGGVIAIQVVEHLTRTQLHQLMDLCSKKVVVGGKVVFETINPQSVTALSSNYFRDPTHVWPLHPDTLSYMMTLAGLDVKEVRMLSPVSDEAQLKPVPVHEYMTPRWMETVGVFNRNITQLNALLYGHQDYAAIAEVR